MEKEHDLFFKILRRLDAAGVLQEIVLIGGWCPVVYKEYFGNPVEISMQRTADLDFLIPSPLRLKQDVNVSLIFEELGFDRKVSLLDGYEKYVHPDLEIEFLTPERGRGQDKPYTIDNLHISAQGLRYLDFIQSHLIKMCYKGISLNVPEPAAYVLHKFIISNKRKKSFKREKDIETACQLGEYLLAHENQRDKMREMFSNMPEKWKRDLLRIVKDASEKISAFLSSGF
ncbi:hypothetical protein KN63_02565 [Smithella sp. F21]|nr:hypothetical protein KN63_02565 [Smithella sp. F21]